MGSAPHRSTLLGRAPELAAIDRLLAGARKGGSGALVLRGEPGIGKTALLEAAAEATGRMRVVGVTGLESETKLAFAGIHQLLVAMPREVERLPPFQKDAFDRVFAFREGATPSRFLVGLGVLNVLSLGAQKGLLCTVDNAEQLDRESLENLGFVARRLEAEGIALIISLRNAAAPLALLEGVPILLLEQLGGADARELLSRSVLGRFDDGVRDRLLGLAQGNPLALLELTKALTGAQLAGAAFAPDPLPLSARLEHSFMQPVDRLPAETRALMLLVAAEPAGDPRLVSRAANELGLDVAALGPAESAGLVRVGGRITFRHALTRSAVYAASAFDERQRVHRALADVTDARSEPDVRTWHRFAGSVDADEDLAQELERSAVRAQAGGRLAAAATLFRRAAERSPDPGRRAGRTLMAAHAELMSGGPRRATVLLEGAVPQLTGELEHAQALRLHGQIALALGEIADASRPLLEAGRAFLPLDVGLARETLLEAVAATMYVGRFEVDRAAQRRGLRQLARDVKSAANGSGAGATAVDLLLDAFVPLVVGSHPAAVPALRRVTAKLADEPDFRWLGLGSQAAVLLWDDELLRRFAFQRARLARSAGALAALPGALQQLGANADVLAGQFDAAEASFAEAREIAAAIGKPGLVGDGNIGEVIAAAWRGHGPRARALAESCARDATARGNGIVVATVQSALVVLELGLGRYPEALTAAAELGDGDPAVVSTFVLPELIEAAVRCGEHELAATAAEELALSTQASGTAWALGTLSRAQALLTEGPAAEPLYQQAIHHLKRCRVRPQLARARLLYGEWLRRQRRRRDAREQLQTAHQMFASMGAEAFAERAATELAATGQRARRRQPETLRQLTPQETRIAQLVSEGAANNDIAAQLFLSPRTVEYHLRKIYRKYGVHSRTQLTRDLLEDGGATPP